MQTALTASEPQECCADELELPGRLVGQILAGRYRVLRRIGAGGMGEVYEVEHRLLACRMALKTLSPSLRSTSAALQRFRQEAELGALLTHPSLVRVFDFELAGPTPYLVMELLKGRDLKSILSEQGPLPVGRAVRLLCDALSGAAAAHALGIVHRDLKPANLFVQSADGAERGRLLDFGVAKRKGQLDAAPDALTISGSPLGTLAYMAPEQIRGARDVDARADVYSAGAMLFEMISGRRSFEAATPPEQMFRVLHETAPRLDELAPGCPAELADIVERAMATKREDRFVDAAQLIAALEPFCSLDSLLQRTRAPSRKVLRRSRALELAAGVALGFLAGYAAAGVRSEHALTVRAAASSLAPASPAAPRVELVSETPAAVPVVTTAVPSVVTAQPISVRGTASVTSRAAARTTRLAPSDSPPSPQVPTIDVERSNPYQ